MKPIAALALLTVAAACAPAAAPPTRTPSPAAAPEPVDLASEHLEIHWVRSSAEYRAITLQTYRAAADRVRELEAGLEDGSWAVIMDADETILDNSEFQRRIAERGEVYTEEAWDAWAREEAATAVPGAAGFVALVRELGGHVAVVTNRHQGICPETRDNLQALRLRVSAVLCQTGTSQKEERFRMVQEGRTGEGLPPLDVIMWVGDNIGDFPDLEQDLRDAPEPALAEFGRRYFVLPNPMYGSWPRNEWR